MVELATMYQPSNTKMRAVDRTFVFEKMGDIKNTTGMVDNRLFSGENRLHAKMDDHSLWYLQMESGLLADPLKQKWTSFSKLKEYIDGYFQRRNVKLKEVID